MAGTLTLLSREIQEVGHPVNLWSPELPPALIRDMAAKVGRGEAQALWVDERHPARGLLIYTPSPWESQQFGWGCARLMGPFLVVEDQKDREDRVRKLARQAIAASQASGHNFITVKTFHDPAILRGFLAENFVMAEIGSSLSGSVPENQIPNSPPPGFLFLEAEDQAELADEVVVTLGDFFYDGHFRHDVVPGPEQAAHLWSQVALADLKGGARPTVVLWDRKKDRAAGLATAHIEGQVARLNILAVTGAYQGRGLGKVIIEEMLNSLRGLALTLKVETASYNLPALALYQKAGLKLSAPLAALHYRGGPQATWFERH